MSINDNTPDIYNFDSEPDYNEVEEDTYTSLQDEPEPEPEQESVDESVDESVQEKAERLYGDKYTIESVSESGNIGNATVTHQGTRYIFSFPLKEDD